MLVAVSILELGSAVSNGNFNSFCWLQVPTEYALGTLRLSTGRHSVKQDVIKAAELIIAGAKKQGVPLT